MAGRPTIKEVSKLAGVSFKTVSRVLNKEKYVSDDTQRRVAEAIAQLGYRKSHAARTLAGGRSFHVALIYDNPSPYYVFNLQLGAQKCCSELGFRLLVQPVDSTSDRLVADVCDLIDEAHLDGIILSPPVTDVPELIAELQQRDLPYVRIAPGLEREEGRAAAMDDVAAAREVVGHLLGLGHRSVAMIRGLENHVSSADRFQGYCEELAAHGIALREELVVAGRNDVSSGMEAAQQLFALDPRPTAIFASNDDMAAGALAAAHEAQIAVPEQLSIVGFDDSDLARAIWPPLTTIRQPVRELAYQAAELLLQPQDVEQVMLDHALIVRGTTAPPGS